VKNIRRWLLGTSALVAGLPLPSGDGPIAGAAPPELLIEISATSNGYEVSLRSPMHRHRRTEHQRTLPNDRGVQQLISLANECDMHCYRSSEAQAVQHFGTTLFRSVFDPSGENLLRASVDLARVNNTFLRIVLELDQALADIPWEYMFDPERGAFLARSHETTLVRYLPAPDGIRPQSGIEQLRILSMAASPHLRDSLDLAADQRRIRNELAPSIASGQVSLDFVDGGTFADLAAALRIVQPHIFHFVGHGDWNDELDDAVVLFEDTHGFVEPRTGIDIGTLLNQPGMRLAIFNCCHAGTPSRSDRLAGITPSLTAQGIPAAVGMQFAFEDRAASVFGSALLRELAEGTAVDQAMTRARLAVFASFPGIDWATPVLTTRVPVGDIIPRS